MDRTDASLLLYFSSCCFLILFFNGFFQIDFPSQNSRNDVNVTKLSNKSEIRGPKLVFVIIDALRADFVVSGSQYLMPYLQRSIEMGESCHILTKAAVPTVTMPRIKAITSGAVPNYMDVIMNLGSQKFEQDTFLRQAVQRGYRIVIYGDDTWLKMFPDLFIRSEGVHSFFASDFWEVDENVTLRLNEELKRTDWDILILHYLGLDHIGHIEGPQSKHIITKLVEMDTLIKHIKSSLDSMHPDTIFVVTGDHGMKDSGGHGGSTYAEIMVPLVSVGKVCRQLPGWPESNKYTPSQIDLASTMSAILNLSTPSDNTGKIIPALLYGMNDEDILLRMKSDVLQLLSLKFLRDGQRDALKRVANIIDHAISANHTDVISASVAFYEVVTSLSDELAKERTAYKLNYLIIGCLGLWIILYIALNTVHLKITGNNVAIFLTVGTVAHTLSLASSSFIEEEHQTWYFLWPTFILLIAHQRFKKVFSFFDKYGIVRFVLLASMHRVARNLNQTGDKWASLPDIHAFLRQHPPFHFAVFIAGAIWLAWIFCRNRYTFLCKAIFLFTLSNTVLYHLAVNDCDITFSYPQSRGQTEVNAFLVGLILFMTVSCRHKIHGSWSWALLISITCRPHNFLLIAMQFVLSDFIHNILPLDEFWNTVAHTWIGAMFYFYQGNSNSLASIDVNAGFIGAESYNPLYAGVMMVSNTYSATLLALLLAKRDRKAILITKLLPLAFFCSIMLIQRHHLFVWSVFSPKLLIMSVEFFVLYIILLLIKIVE